MSPNTALSYPVARLMHKAILSVLLGLCMSASAGEQTAAPSLLMPDGKLPALDDGERFPSDQGETNRSPQPSCDLPAAGVCVLRSGAEDARDQTYLMLDYGGSAGEHAHDDTMQIILYARRKYLSPDLKAPRRDTPDYATWYRDALSHNTMTPLPHAGTTVYFEHAPRIKIIDVESPPGRTPRHRRTVALVRNYIVDLFRADADEEQEHAWRYHNIGLLEPRAAIEPDGAGWVHAHWDLGDGQALRLSALRREGTTFVPLTGLAEDPSKPLYYVGARRKSKTFLVPSVIEPFLDITRDTTTTTGGTAKALADEATKIVTDQQDVGAEDKGEPAEPDPVDQQIKEREKPKTSAFETVRLPFQIAGDRTLLPFKVDTQEGQAAFTVEGPGEARDYYLASYDAEQVWKTEEVEFQGEIGIVLTDQFRPTDALMVRGKLLSVGGWTIAAEALTTVHVYVADDGLRIHTGPKTQGQLSLRVRDARLGSLLLLRKGETPRPVGAEAKGDAVRFAATGSSDYLLKLHTSRP